MSDKLSERTPQTKLDALEALPDSELLEKAWGEISALCGADKGPQKRWTMSVPVDAERDSDVLFGEVLKRYAALEAKLSKMEKAAINSPCRISIEPDEVAIHCDGCERLHELGRDALAGGDDE